MPVSGSARSTKNRIGPVLREFLEESNRAALVMDMARSGVIGKKIKKYITLDISFIFQCINSTTEIQE
ncbi:MAG: hypothetical protein RBG13Loki_3821 [Promethearchaeota archaeon CR_4]|nr:MAG: hypothetical protein RBG13Loki_3821 [Candidatus Lokiarchaeota archaeon CR_4]